MFEYDQEIVQSLLRDDRAFKSLYERHDQLNTLVHEAELGSVPTDDATLNSLKREKLQAKDNMAAIIEKYRKANEVHH